MSMRDVYVPPGLLPPAPESGEVAAPRTHVRRSSTENVRRIPKRHLALLADDISQEELDEAAELRPKVRADCAAITGPCPFVSCKYNLFLDVTRTGNITYNFPGKEIDELPETCALDIAERGGVTLNEVGDLFQLSRERIRQIENKILDKLKRHPAALAVLSAGGFEHSVPTHLTEDHGEGGGGTTTIPEGEGRYDKTPDQEFSDKVDRIYERTSRERALGLRPNTPLTLRADDDVPEPPEGELESQEDPEPPAPETPIVLDVSVVEVHRSTPLESHTEAPMARPKVEEVAHTQTRSILAAYRELANRHGGRPSPLEVALHAGLKGARGSISANVCNALKRLERNGETLPFYDQPIRRGEGGAPPVKPARPSIEELPLSPREQLVVAAYQRLARTLGRRPRSSEVAEAMGKDAPAKNPSANVSSALNKAIIKGEKLLFWDSLPPRAPNGPSLRATIREKTERQVKEEMLPPPPDPPPASVQVAPPDPPTRPGMIQDAPQDAFKTALQTKREVLLRQLAAIDTLLAS